MRELLYQFVLAFGCYQQTLTTAGAVGSSFCFVDSLSGKCEVLFAAQPVSVLVFCLLE